ncbi:MAG TPA: nitrate- and nitrite sensing domain-containing protein [Kineosporiaceae bacterium]
MVSPPSRPQRSGRLPRTIGARLAFILTLPLLGMLVLLAAGVAQEVQQYRTAERTAAATRLRLAVEGLVHQLQQERGLTNGLLNGEVGAQPQVDAQRAAAGTARRELDRAVRAAPDEVSGDVRRAMGGLDGLADVRARVDARQIPAGEAFTFYTRLIATLSGSDLGLGTAPDARLDAAGRSLIALSMAKEYVAQERGFMNGVFSHRRFASLDEYAHFSLLRAGRQDWLQTFASVATPEQRKIVDVVTTSSGAQQSAGDERQAALAADGRALTVSPIRWWRVMTQQIDGLRDAQIAVGRDLTARADELRSGALRGLGILILAAAALICGAIVVVLVAARSISRPLGELVREADDVAQRRLPEAVRRLLLEGEAVTAEPLPPVRLPRGSSDEVKGVVASLDRMQSAAHRLAVEQAVIRRSTVEALASLGRRNQNLVRRQLGLISQLERQESEPAALASLFQLDHLAARMRRNAESLLVVAGERRSRTRSASLPIADAVRAATSGVENYLRVSVQRVDDAIVQSSVVSDVVHLLAELIENGLAFSPPDADLEVHGRWVERGYLVAIVDHGVGMAPADLADANARLQAVDGFLSAPTRFLGHHVVARLSHRLGAQVTLITSPVTGVTARVILPAGAVVVAPSALPGLPHGGLSPAEGPPPSTPPPSTPPPSTPPPSTPPAPAPDARDRAALSLAGNVEDAGSLPVRAWAERHRGAQTRSVQHARVAPDVRVAPTSLPAAPGVDPPRSRSATSIGAPSDDAGGRTRNGLPRRVSGGQFVEPDAPAVTGRPEPAGRVDHSPEQVRSRLGAFRSGVRRGVQHNLSSVSPVPGGGSGGRPGSDEEKQ